MLTLWNRSIKTNPPARIHSRGEPNLAAAINGSQVTITGFGDRLPASQREMLQAYGLNPGREVLILQQKPVTVVQVDHTELAFETQVARLVKVRMS